MASYLWPDWQLGSKCRSKFLVSLLYLNAPDKHLTYGSGHRLLGVLKHGFTSGFLKDW
jgi:hypothetical protein